MRFIFSARLVLMLAACASQGPTAPPASDASNPTTATDTVRITAAKQTIDVDKSSV
ncbi:MAG: transglycosylase SLT domain-containing protein, partial [Trinickia sp.]